jgi:hypothetical protein
MALVVNETITDEPKVDAKLLAFYDKYSPRNYFAPSWPLNYNGSARVEIRGQSTQEVFGSCLGSLYWNFFSLLCSQQMFCV